ncbi:unnamed protein product [Amoebophrya sp. A120]|nr:unnamed protein product [Amoebophrya sp. A120]|eukprot:GSA120T00011943001.1
MSVRNKLKIDDIVQEDERRSAQEYECAVCMSLWHQDAVQTDCHHIFCGSCVSGLLACPTCRKPFGEEKPKPLRDSNPFALRVLNGLKVTCPNAAAEASGTGLGNLSGSASEEPGPAAKKRKANNSKAVRAPGSSSSSSSSSFLVAHQHADSDEFLYCTWTGSYGDLLAKHLAECECQIVDCPRGCGESMQRRNLTVHEAHCQKLLVECSICGEKMKPDAVEAHRRERAELHVTILEKRLADVGADPAGGGSKLDQMHSLMQAMDKRITKIEKEGAKATKVAEVDKRLVKVESNGAKTAHVTAIGKKTADQLGSVIKNLKNICGTLAVDWTINTADLYRRCTRKGHKEWSPPFFLPGPVGPFYALVTPHGCSTGTGTHCSFYIGYKGETDAASEDRPIATRVPPWSVYFRKGRADVSGHVDESLAIVTHNGVGQCINLGTRGIGWSNIKSLPVSEIKASPYITIMIRFGPARQKKDGTFPMDNEIVTAILKTGP